MNLRHRTFAFCLTLAFSMLLAGSASADIAPPEDESCEGYLAGAECSEVEGCVTGWCREDDDDRECQLECIDGTCVECEEEEDAGVPDDGDASIIYTTGGGCNATASRPSYLGPALLALVVPFIVFGLRRRH